jgi:tetratricopeptide (TPR) repeat protein
MADQKPVISRRIRLVVGVTLLLAVMAAELALSARQQSQTFDEAAHIFAGYRYWTTFDFGANPEHPPLVKLVAAIPLLRLPLRVPSIPIDLFKLVEYKTGREFLYGNDANVLLWRARMAAAVFTICLALTVFLVAYSMWGEGPAFLALTLLVFEPNLLAHGALVTTDVGVTFGFILAVGAFYFYLKKPSVLRLCGAGIAAGICLGAKHSGILIFPMLFVLALAELLSLRDPATKKFPAGIARDTLFQAASLAAIAAISIAVLWSFYGFRYAARPSDLAMKPTFAEFVNLLGSNSSAILQQIAHWHLLPESYLYGLVDIFAQPTLATIVMGKFFPSAQWFYFPAVFTIKSTLAFLMLCFLAPLCVALWGKQFRRELLFLVIPIAIYLAVAMSSGDNHGIRHLLPVFPFVIIIVSFAAWNLATRHRALAVLLGVLVVCHAWSSVRAFPNYIPYANELWGGSAKSYQLVTDSDVDWGQGLTALKQYIDQRQIKKCWLAYFGSQIVDISYYGIPCTILPRATAGSIRPGMPIVPPQVNDPVFIGASELSQLFSVADWINPYLPFQQVHPSAVIANSILVYDGKVDLSQVSSLMHENLATQFLRANKFDEALVEAETAIEIAPNQTAAHATRSAILAAMGRKTEALAEIKKAEAMENTALHSR